STAFEVDSNIWNIF
nr:L-2,4-diaminobutyrate decarboxylase, DABA decarboxylase {N-terminal} [Vibrio alginolyticus, Peptide Partial, 14 aa] [Vibrio alginolyticus]